MNTCDICKRYIEENEPHKTVNLHTERRNGNVVTVDLAETTLTTCLKCGANFHREAITRVLNGTSNQKALEIGELLVPREAK